MQSVDTPARAGRSSQSNDDRRHGLTILPATIASALALFFLVGDAAVATAGPSGDGSQRLSVLVTMAPRADRRPVRSLAASHGAQVKYEYKAVLKSVLAIRSLPVAAVGALERTPGVLRVDRDEWIENAIKLDDSVTRIRGSQGQLADAGLAADGAGVRVCVIDTGIDTDHEMFSGRIDFAASYDFANDDSDPEDDHGHGTHVAAAALGATGFTVDHGCVGPEAIQGVAPAATLIGVKALRSDGSGFTSDIIAGIDRCADPSSPGGAADVINLSIGTGEFATHCDELHSWAQAANDAVAAGVVVVAASGNEAFANAMASPACGSDVIAVGATYDNDYPNCEDSQASFTWCFDFFCTRSCTDDAPPADSHVCFSNQSDWLDVSAPGCVITSAGTAPGGLGITEMCGTSMAAPHVAGLAALVLGRNPALTPAEVRDLIRSGAVDIGGDGFDRAHGYGRIDVVGTLSLMQGCANDADCNDGAFCNGVETCDAGFCTTGTAPCAAALCDEAADLCGGPACNDNGLCEDGEDCTSCPGDCASAADAICGNGVCEAGGGEDCVTCPADCAGKLGGKPSGRFCCGDLGGAGTVGCGDSRCTSKGFSCSTSAMGYCCGDGECSSAEDSYFCSLDCGPPPVCGDGECNGDETACTCPSDCPVSGETCTNGVDDDCDGLVDCEDSTCGFHPSCVCADPGSECVVDSDCCSGSCKHGRTRTCR